MARARAGFSGSPECRSENSCKYTQLINCDLTIFPGNHLEALKGDRKGQHSIRINDQYRILFHLAR